MHQKYWGQKRWRMSEVKQGVDFGHFFLKKHLKVGRVNWRGVSYVWLAEWGIKFEHTRSKISIYVI
jgi:hypothetical protein